MQNTDHYPIEITLGAKSGVKDGAQADPKRFNLTLANWEKFDEVIFSCSCTNLEGLGVESVENVERYASALGKSILEACEAAIPRKKTHVKSYPWWTRKLTRTKKLVHQAKRAYQRGRDELVKNTLSVKYRTLRKQCSTGIKRTRESSWRDFVTKKGNQEKWGPVYRTCAKKVSVKSAMCTLNRNGASTENFKETARCFLETHIVDDDQENETLDQEKTRANTILLDKALKTMKNKKSPGPDLIENEVVKRAGVILRDQFLEL